ncbi:hypothetical protein NLS1_31250 [Nocardioides sp. LS1]|nr:hypothetical protein NLS1_31250 [Nocardioides sp. LS1]
MAAAPCLMRIRSRKRAALGDPRFSTNIRTHGYPTNSAEQATIESEFSIRMDGAEPAQRRRAVGPGAHAQAGSRCCSRIIEIIECVLGKIRGARRSPRHQADSALHIAT